MKQILILGLGGSGSRYTKFFRKFKDTDLKIHFSVGTDDCGGSTGEIFEVLERMNLSGITGIHPRYKDIYKVVPLGDLRNIIVNMIAVNISNQDIAEQVAALFDFRSNYMSELKSRFLDLKKTNAFNFTEEFANRFLLFIEKYFSTLGTNYSEIFESYSRKAGFEVDEKEKSLGNLILTFLYLTCESQEEFYQKLCEMKFLDEMFHPHFTTDFRTNSYAVTSETEQLVFSEIRIDHAREQLQPRSFGLVHAEVQEEIFENKLNARNLNSDLINAIENSDAIVYTSGSWANLGPLLNILSEKIKEINIARKENKQPELLELWIGNLFYGLNERPIQLYAKYIYEVLELEPILLTLNYFDQRNLKSFDGMKDDYLKQGKVANSPEIIRAVVNNGAKQLVFPVLGIESSKPNFDYETLEATLGKVGIKHSGNEVVHFISMFVEEFLNLYEMGYEKCEILRIFQETNRLMLQDHELLIDAVKNQIYDNGDVDLTSTIVRFLKLKLSEVMKKIYPEIRIK